MKKPQKTQCIILNNIEELLIREYYRKYLSIPMKCNNFYEKELLNTYSNIYSSNR